jgi:hypothetical protein
VSITVPSSPGGVTWTVQVDNNTVGSVIGNALYGPLFLNSGDTATITGNPPTSVAALTTIATAVGAVSPQTEQDPLAPSSAGGLTPPLVFIIGITSLSSVTFTPSPAAQGLMIAANVGPSGIAQTLPDGSVVADPIATLFPITASEGLFYGGPIIGGLPTTVTFEAAGIAHIYEVDAALTLPSSWCYIIAPANPSVGVDWSYALPHGARLQAVEAILACSATVANRLALLQLSVGSGNPALCPVGIGPEVAGRNLFAQWSIHATQIGPLAGAGNSDFATGAMPDILLPPGSVVQSNTQNLQATDQWESITLTFSGN